MIPTPVPLIVGLVTAKPEAVTRQNPRAAGRRCTTVALAA
jgi:hypothetical protein